MFLSVKEMELRKIRFDETLQPGRIDFAGEDLEQVSPLQASALAEVVEAFRGGSSHPRPLFGGDGSAVRPLSGTARFPLDESFDLFYRPIRSSRAMRKLRSTKAKRRSDFTKMAAWNWRIFFGSRCCWRCRCREFAATSAREFARLRQKPQRERVRLQTRPRGDRWGALRKLGSQLLRPEPARWTRLQR